MVYWMLYDKSSPYAHHPRNDEELFFFDEQGKQFKFPSSSDDPTLDLSVIVPAYNEQYRRKFNFKIFNDYHLCIIKRLYLVRPMLDSCLQWLVTVKKSSFEVIVVSDGSTDRTCDVVMEYVEQYGAEQIRLLKLCKNRGKGGAVCLVSNTKLMNPVQK